MQYFLNLLLNKLPIGYIISFRIKKVFFESSTSIGNVLEITISNENFKQYSISITEEFILQAASIDTIIDQQIQSIFDELKK